MSAKMLLLFSHSLNAKQIHSAKHELNIISFVNLPSELQDKWSNVPADLNDLSDYSSDFKNFLEKNSSAGDVALIQGDFGLCYIMINYAKSLGLRSVYATTKRVCSEKIIDGKCIKESIFEHVIFRDFQ
nr:CRISPR-associated protein Csx20 [uncultured Campylobacter sp.]